MGTNMQGIVDAARQLGMKASAMRAKEKCWEILSGLERPSIVHFEKEGGVLHFVVLYKWKGDSAEIMDPSEGRLINISKERFMDAWSGYVAIIFPSDDFVKEDRTIRVWRKFMDVISFSRKELTLASAGSMVYVLVGLSTSVFIQQLVDIAIPQRNMRMLMVFGLAMMLMTAASFVIGYVRSVLTVEAGLETDSRLVSDYLKKILSLPMSFYSNRSTGELNSRVRDVYSIRNFLTVRLMVICICILALVSALVLMFTFCWKMAIVVAAYFPVYAILYGLSDSMSRKVNRSVIESSAAFDSAAVEVFAGIRTVRLNGWEDSFLNSLVRKYQKYVYESWRGGKTMIGYAVASDGTARLLTYAVLVAGTVLVFGESLTAGELVSFYTITSFFTAPVNSLIESNNDIAQATIAAERLFEVLEMDPENGEVGELDPSLYGGDIRVESLCFSFPGMMPLFDDLNITFPAGTVTAVRGGNGSGKSTLAMLLLRGYVPYKGRITMDGIDISGFNIRKWRRYVSIVPQKAELFSGTILHNIAPEETEPDAGRISSLCVSVGLNETLVRLPDGILSEVGEGGCRLSGGERQKVAMVRALYRGSNVLIMDEATASMDKPGRNRVMGLVKKLAGEGKTVIMITHDESCLTAADRIVDV